MLRIPADIDPPYTQYPTEAKHLSLCLRDEEVGCVQAKYEYPGPGPLSVLAARMTLASASVALIARVIRIDSVHEPAREFSRPQRMLTT